MDNLPIPQKVEIEDILSASLCDDDFDDTFAIGFVLKNTNEEDATKIAIDLFKYLDKESYDKEWATDLVDIVVKQYNVLTKKTDKLCLYVKASNLLKEINVYRMVYRYFKLISKNEKFEYLGIFKMKGALIEVFEDYEGILPESNIKITFSFRYEFLPDSSKQRIITCHAKPQVFNVHLDEYLKHAYPVDKSEVSSKSIH
ncbi:hypothetical protein [Pelotomaculum propionicicum]|uniref:Uncharacterized protein n=1 Tax=Pelotomaculum propionicicum TaxID=258475 RepID=A0A4Y7RJB7_9FIRM|nr:hypothetical protein [Pelotomaculum propionicicum]TEB09075.1 hypothetical protein Pmgp_03431 [Pelotomaculum propionicicum]